MKVFKKIIFLAVLIILFGRVVSVGATTSTNPDFKVAIIGDTGAGSNFQSVLDLIKIEGAQFVIHSGDFDYNEGVSKWTGMIKI